VRPRRDADHLPPSTAEVKNGQNLYLPSPLAPAWRTGTSLLLLPCVLQAFPTDLVTLIESYRLKVKSTDHEPMQLHLNREL
jgi:hypothetical protein